MTYTDVDEALRTRVPEFADAIEDYLSTYGEPLPHVLFGDLTRFVVDAHQRGDQAVVGRCLDILDRAMRDGDDDVVNLVQVSFVENIGPWSDAVAAFVATWPVSLQREAERQRNWKPGDPGPAGML